MLHAVLPPMRRTPLLKYHNDAVTSSYELRLDFSLRTQHFCA
jgi:hypothetical protein